MSSTERYEKVKATTFALLFAPLVFATGCAHRLTGTPLDLLPLPLPITATDPQARVQLEEVLGKFLEVCDREANESVPPRPFQLGHLYVYDATENVMGMWSSHIFDDYKGWIDIYKTHKDVSIIKDLTKVVPGPGRYLLKRAVLEQTTIGKITYRGGRQEFIDTTTGEVKASRTNYYLGSDFARGVSCLDSSWRDGFVSFVTRSIGFSPGFPRADSWVRKIPRGYVRAELRSRRATDTADYMAPIRPEGSIYNYNERSIAINGVAHYLRQTFNNEPLPIVGVQSFPSRVLISYETNSGAPSVLFQIRNKNTGQLLQEIYVKLPLALHQRNDKSIRLYPWRLAKEGVTFQGGKVFFDVVRNETERGSKDQRHFRYSLDAPWNTESIERSDVPGYLDNGSYGMFSLPKKEVGGPLSEENVIGQWVSEPAGALWEFKSDKTIVLDGTKWIWRIDDGVLSAEYDHPNRDRATFQASRDGKVLEVTLSNRVGTYEPFVIRRFQFNNTTVTQDNATGCIADRFGSGFETHQVRLYNGGGKKMKARLDRIGNQTREVRVVVNNPMKKTVLDLFAYDPVVWSVSRTPRSEIVGIVVNGYHGQAVLGVGNNTPIMISTYEYNPRTNCSSREMGKIRQAISVAESVDNTHSSSLVVVGSKNYEEDSLIVSNDFNLDDYTVH